MLPIGQLNKIISTLLKTGSRLRSEDMISVTCEGYHILSRQRPIREQLFNFNAILYNTC